MYYAIQVLYAKSPFCKEQSQSVTVKRFNGFLLLCCRLCFWFVIDWMLFFSFSVCIVSVTLLVLLLCWYGFPGTLEHWHLSMGFFQLGVLLLVFTFYMNFFKKRSTIWQKQRISTVISKMYYTIQVLYAKSPVSKEQSQSVTVKRFNGFLLQCCRLCFWFVIDLMLFFSFSVCIVSVTLLVLLLWWYGFPGLTLEHWHLSMGFFKLGDFFFQSVIFTKHRYSVRFLCVSCFQHLFRWRTFS